MNAAVMLYQQGIAHYQAADYQQGVACFSQVIDTESQWVIESYYERSKCYEALGQIALARQDLGQVLALAPDNVWRKRVHTISDLLMKVDTSHVLPHSKIIPRGVTVKENSLGLTITIMPPWGQKLRRFLQHGAGKLFTDVIIIFFVVMGIVLIKDSSYRSIIPDFVKHYSWLLNPNIYGLFLIILPLPFLFYQIYESMVILLNRITMTLDTQCLTVIYGPLPYRNPEPVVVLRSMLSYVQCKRHISSNKDGKESYSLQVDNTLLIGEPPDQGDIFRLYNDIQLSYVRWKLRDTLDLPQDLLFDDYLPAAKATVYDYRPIRELDKGDVGNGLGIILVFCLPFMICSWLTFSNYQETHLLQTSPKFTQGQIINKRVVRGKSTTYVIKYVYTAQLSLGKTKQFTSEDEVSAEVYAQVKQTAVIIYAADNPAISRVSADFTPRREYLDQGCMFLIGFWILASGFSLGFPAVRGMRQAQKITDAGRVTQGVVVYKNHRTWENKGLRHAYDVYYRYYGYEAKFDSQKAFEKLEVGDTLRVGYLPNKPHLSKPYY